MSQVGTVRVSVTGKNIDVTQALKDYSEKRVAKLGKYFQQRGDIEVSVVLSVENDEQVAEITYYLGGFILRGESRTKDLYASIDEASDRIERQVRKYKTRIQRKVHISPRFGDGLDTASQEAAPEAAGSAGAAEGTDAAERIVRTKRFPVKPMDVDEAILQMELLGHDFFVFANAGTESINVVYKRKDGHYGLLEPIFG